ncbi:MAG: type I restriction enzyme HsdR N-terminal domain-containing protein [Acidobacteria bacterium]|nr:type I restriction enzyme HsdR N-terminal domain-containing protein [Acidobacteriota bacterium]
MTVDICKALKKMVPHLLKARDENLNEADTVQRIVKVFEDVLGYDPMTEITGELKVKDKFVDLAIKLGGVTRLLVEAKAAAITLRDRHIEQAERYAAEGNIRWVLLTNGVVWNLYHLTFEEGIEYERVYSVDLSLDSMDKAAELLSLLDKKALLKGDHEEFWQRRMALSPESVAKALFTENVLSFIRREIRKSEGILLDIEDIATALHESFSTESRERIGLVRIRKRRKPKARRPAGSEAAPATDLSDPETSTSTELEKR